MADKVLKHNRDFCESFLQTSVSIKGYMPPDKISSSQYLRRLHCNSEGNSICGSSVRVCAPNIL